MSHQFLFPSSPSYNTYLAFKSCICLCMSLLRLPILCPSASCRWSSSRRLEFSSFSRFSKDSRLSRVVTRALSTAFSLSSLCSFSTVFCRDSSSSWTRPSLFPSRLLMVASRLCAMRGIHKMWN